MTGRRILFTNWLIYIFLALIMYFWENVAILDFSNPFRPFTLSEIILFFLGLVLVTTIYLFIEKKRNHFKPNYVILFLCVGIFIYSLIVILVTPSVKTFDFADRFNPEIIYHGVFLVTAEKKTYYIFFAFLSLLVCYLTLDLFPKKIAFLKVFDIGFYLAATVTLVCMIFSYIVEWDQYVTIITNFNQGIIKEYIYSVKSFFNNRSNYSMLLLFMIFYCLLVHYSHQKWWWLYVIAAFIFVNLCFTTSKTNIPLGFFLIIGYLLARFIITFKGHKKRNIIAASSITLFLIACVVTFVILYNCSPISENLHKSMEELFKVSKGTVESRQFIWKACVDILNNSNWLLGAGFGLFNDLLREYMAFNNYDSPTNMPHNYFLQVLGEGGVIYLAFIIFTLVLLIIFMVKIAKKHTSLVVLESLFLVTFIVHGLLEANGPIAHSLPSVEGVFYTYLLYVPIFSIYYHESHPEDNLELKKEASKFGKLRNKYLSNPYSISNALYYVSTFLLIFMIGPVMGSLGKNVPMLLLIGVITLSILYLILPYIIHRIYHMDTGVDKEYLSIGRYIYKVMLPFLINLVIGIALARIYISLMGGGFGVVIFMGFVNLSIYVGSFVFIPRFKENAELVNVFLANLNNRTLSIYDKFI